MLGTAVGVPLWIVFGSGGAFAGELLNEIVEELETDFSGETYAKRIDEELGIEPDPLDMVRERLEQLKEEVRSGGNPSQLLQKWFLRRKQ